MILKVQVGIDLGTTNTVCCWLEDGKQRYVKFSGKDTLPSYLLYQKGQLMIGEAARRRAIQFPQSFIRSAKTHMGDDNWQRVIDDRTFNSTDVATEVLRYVRDELISQRQLPKDVIVEAVITVPAYFKAKQREETKKAGEAGGFFVKNIIQEPVAAALADTAKRQDEERLFVIDLGGGTFDVSILKYSPQEQESFIIENIDGDAKLGGDNFDEEIKEWLFSQITMETGINLRDDECGVSNIEMVREKLHKVAEDLKIDLSMKTTSSKKMGNLFINLNGQPYHLDVTMTREQFEDQCSRIFRKIERIIKRCLKEKSFKPTDINRILLVGGSSQMPKIYEMTKTIFGTEPFKNKDLSKIVAVGASLLAKDADGLMNQKIVHMLPHTLGIEVVDEDVDGVMKPMLKRGTRYPTKEYKERFTTSLDYQEVINLNVYEGENNLVKDNSLYGALKLEGIEKALSGIPDIEISFMFDADGILHVKAKDLRTNAEMNEKLTRNSHVSIPESVQATNIALMIDTSGSMRKEDKMNKAKKAAKTLVDQQLNLKEHYVAIVGFAEGIKLLNGFTQSKQKLHQSINKLEPYGGTHLQVAFRKMNPLFKQGPCSSNCAIMVTDGRTSNEKSAIAEATKLKEEGVRLVAIGVGEDVKLDYLQGIASSESDCFSIKNMDELTDVFAKVSNTLKVVNN